VTKWRERERNENAVEEGEEGPGWSSFAVREFLAILLRRFGSGNVRVANRKDKYNRPGIPTRPARFSAYGATTFALRQTQLRFHDKKVKYRFAPRCVRSRCTDVHKRTAGMFYQRSKLDNIFSSNALSPRSRYAPRREGIRVFVISAVRKIRRFSKTRGRIADCIRFARESAREEESNQWADSELINARLRTAIRNAIHPAKGFPCQGIRD